VREGGFHRKYVVAAAALPLAAAFFVAHVSPAVAQSKDLACQVGGYDMQITFDAQRGTMSALLNGHSYNLKYVRISPSSLWGSAPDFNVLINRYNGAINFWPMRQTSHGREYNGHPPPPGSCHPGQLKQMF